MATHEDWTNARMQRDGYAVNCARALLAGRADEASRYAGMFAVADADMSRLERALDGQGG